MASKFNFNIGFSLFRIMLGITMIIPGYDKVVKIFSIGFNPDKFELLQWFLHALHGSESKMPPHVQIFFPEFSIYILCYLIPFWEIIIGLSLVLGIYRKLGTNLGLALMAIFLSGTVGAGLGLELFIEQVVLGIAYYLLYLGLIKNLDDPLSVDRFLKK